MKHVCNNHVFRLTCLLLLFVTLTSFGCSEPGAAPETDPKFLSHLPKPGENNVWYKRNNSPTVVVFLHGILGDSRSTWLYSRNSRPTEYWPDLVGNDPVFSSAGVYLGGYYTSIDSQLYDGRDAADELLRALKRDGVLDKHNILFICHSTGGIIARYMLYHNREEFAKKRIGMLLIASPSYGSKLADVSPLNYLIELFNNKMSSQLKWDNVFLEELDGNFKNVIHQKLLPAIVGREAVENHFIIHRKWLPNRRLVVEPESAGRYFARPVRLRNTDHFSAVKPDGRRHAAHELLTDFYVNEFRGLIVSLTEAKVRDLKARAAHLYGLYQSTGSYGVDSEAGRLVMRDAGPLAADMLLIDDDFLGRGYLIAKYEYAAFAYVLAASVENRPANANRLAEDALKAASQAVLRIGDVMDAVARGDSHAQAISKWLRESEDLNRVRSLIVIAHAIRVRAGGASGKKDVEAALNEVDPDYLQRFPPTAHPDVNRVLDQKARMR